MNIKKHLPWLGALLPIINAQADTNPKCSYHLYRRHGYR